MAFQQQGPHLECSKVLEPMAFQQQGPFRSISCGLGGGFEAKVEWSEVLAPMAFQHQGPMWSISWASPFSSGA